MSEEEAGGQLEEGRLFDRLHGFRKSLSEILPIELIDIFRMKDNVGIDPHQLAVALGEGIGRKLVRVGIDGRVSPHAPFTRKFPATPNTLRWKAARELRG